MYTEDPAHPNQLTAIYGQQLSALNSFVTNNNIGAFSFVANSSSSNGAGATLSPGPAPGSSPSSAGSPPPGQAPAGKASTGTSTGAPAADSTAIPDFKPGKVLNVGLMAHDIFGNAMEVPDALQGLTEGPTVRAQFCYYWQPLGEPLHQAAALQCQAASA